MPLLDDLLQWRAALPEPLPRRRRMLIHPADFDELRRVLRDSEILTRECAADLLLSDFNIEVIVEPSCLLGHVVMFALDMPSWRLPGDTGDALRPQPPLPATAAAPPERQSLWERLEGDED